MSSCCLWWHLSSLCFLPRWMFFCCFVLQGCQENGKNWREKQQEQQQHLTNYSWALSDVVVPGLYMMWMWMSTVTTKPLIVGAKNKPWYSIYEKRMNKTRFLFWLFFCFYLLFDILLLIIYIYILNKTVESDHRELEIIIIKCNWNTCYFFVRPSNIFSLPFFFSFVVNLNMTLHLMMIHQVA